MKSWKQVLIHTPFMPYIPPDYILKELYCLDPQLTIRWSDEVQKWCIEKKILQSVQYINSLPHYKKRCGTEVENDSWIRARNGSVLIGFYNAQPALGDWVVRNLRYYDIRRFVGGAKEVELQMVRAEEKAIEDRNRRDSWTNKEIGEDFYNSEVWRQGERVAVPSAYKTTKTSQAT